MNIMTALFDQDYVTRMYGVDQKREGLKEGMKAGLKEGKRETAMNLLKMGMSADVVAKATGLSAEEIEDLRHQ